MYGAITGDEVAALTKPQRGRVPIDPGIEGWHGMSVNGFLTRSVLDTALLLDATTAGGVSGQGPESPNGSFAEAARTPPGGKGTGSPLTGLTGPV